MATSTEDMQNTKLTIRKFKEGDKDWSDFSKQIFKEDTSHKCPTYVHRTPPCQGSCPSGEDIARIEMLSNQGRYQDAVETILLENPFPAVCGRVCFHPCETVCNRAGLDDPVAIHATVLGETGQRAVAVNVCPGCPFQQRGGIRSGQRSLLQLYREYIRAIWCFSLYRHFRQLLGFLGLGAGAWRYP